MKTVQEQHQPNSMESNVDSESGNATEYAYRPLTTKHRRAGSTGTTGDEEYTTDEEEFYTDSTDFASLGGGGGGSSTQTYQIHKSDLTRAATDLFGYGEKPNHQEDSPTGLFDEKDSNYVDESRDFSTTADDYKLTKAKILLDSECDDRKVNEANKKADEKIAAKEPASEVKNKDVLDEKADGKATTPTRLQWDKSVAEVKEQAMAKLQEELRNAYDKLKLKDEEVARLSRIRQDVESELEDLTASLFLEAHSMVNDANTRQANAERLLAESLMKVEVLAAEVTALKTLLLTSTPSMPNPHLHPQIDQRRTGGTSDESIFTKKHKRSPSHFNLKYGRECSPPESPTKEHKSLGYGGEREATDCDHHRDSSGSKVTPELEIDPRLNEEFLKWKLKPSIDKKDPFVARIFSEDIDFCLDFPNCELGGKVRQAVLDGTVFIEAISDKTKLLFPKKCALLDATRQCQYQMRLGDQENQWHCISKLCRNRIIAVCDFLNYLRYVERGLVKSSNNDIYWEITRLRKEMVLARLGLMFSC